MAIRLPEIKQNKIRKPFYILFCFISGSLIAIIILAVLLAVVVVVFIFYFALFQEV
jgi:flagellar basal body-associated protein FliL